MKPATERSVEVATVMADGADLGGLGEEVVTKQARKRVGIVVEPEKVATWDHRKMVALKEG